MTESDMPTVFEKLNLKNQKEIVVLNAPNSFQSALASLEGVKILTSLEQAGDIDFILSFVTIKEEVDSLSPIVAQKAREDAVVWFAYPKGTSKKYTCDFNRDNGWNVFTSLGFQPVRMVAIDEDWSALRMRRSIFIKK
jgi:hypothetical protein